MRTPFHTVLLPLTLLGNLHALPEGGLLALWDFESGSSNSITGAEALPNGSFQGNASVSSTGIPIMGSYLQLDGDGDYMDVGDHPFFQDLDGSWSAAAWFRAERAPAGDESFFIFETSGGFPISLGLSEGGAGFTNAQVLTEVVGGLDSSPSLDIQIPNDDITDWNHVLITYENVSGTRTLRAYLNGEVVDSITPTSALTSSSNGFHVGTDRDANGNWFLGGIDEVALWNRALTPLEAGFFQDHIIVTTLTDEDNGNLDSASGDGTSLREAITYASENSYIEFAPSLNGETLTLTEGQLLIPTSLTIDASGLSEGFTIDANGRVTEHRVIEIETNNSVTLHGLTLTDGEALTGATSLDVSGGAIFFEADDSDSSAQLALFSCTLVDNAAVLGGAIFNGAIAGGNANLSLNDCIIFENFSGFQGGGISSFGTTDSNASMNILNSTFSGNAAVDDGGGLYSNNTNAILSACSFINNSAILGGGIHGEGNESLSLNDCTFSENSAVEDGGGIYGTSNESLSLDGCTFSENSAVEDGGGIFSLSNMNVDLNNCTITENSAEESGGGIYSNSISGNRNVNLSNCTISGNSADISGGGIFSETSFTGALNLILNNSILAENTAPTGPDLGETGIAVSITATGNNLVSSLAGQTTLAASDPSVTLLTGPLLLAPLANHGGPTMTLPPLPGSPALNAGGSVNPGGFDQRGLPRFADGALDIGAVEVQTGEFIDDGTTPFPFPIADFATDSDQDGTPNGLEFILGTDHLIPDTQSSRNPSVSLDGPNTIRLRFGRNDTDLPPGITLNILRSTTLEPDSFVTAGSYESTNDSSSSAFIINDDQFTFTDPSPFAAKAFYRLEATFLPN